MRGEKFFSARIFRNGEYPVRTKRMASVAWPLNFAHGCLLYRCGDDFGMRGLYDLEMVSGEIEDLDLRRQFTPSEISVVDEPVGVRLFCGAEEKYTCVYRFRVVCIGTGLFFYTFAADR